MSLEQAIVDLTAAINRLAAKESPEPAPAPVAEPAPKRSPGRPKKAEPDPAPAPAPAPAPETLGDGALIAARLNALRTLAGQVVAKVGAPALTSRLQGTFGIGKISDLKPEQYPAAKAALDALLAPEADPTA